MTQHRASPTPADRRHDPQGTGTDLPQGAGEAGVRAVHHRQGHGGRPAPVPPIRRRSRSRLLAPAPVSRSARINPGSGSSSITSQQSDSDQRPIKIVPKGLRSFDEHDADFFLELLPGPRDRDGLPESIRFWKRKIEQIDPDLTFRVGLIYGPSGCGKSSLVKAGFCPGWASTSFRSTSRRPPRRPKPGCSRAYARRVPNLPQGLGLVDSLANLRRGRILPPERKVLLVLDQFEQWLHAKRVRRTPNWSPLFGTAMASMSRRS